MSMQLTRSRWGVLAGLLCVVLASGCGSDPKNDAEEERFHMDVTPEQEGYVEFVGYVTYVPFEGGFYGLIAGTDQYDPLQLPKSFQHDGMKVRVRARLRDWVSGRNWGRMIHIVRIEPCCEPQGEDDD